MLRRCVVFLAGMALISANMALGQSSGNFSYGTTPNSSMACTLQNNGSGTITGGVQCESNCTLDGSGNLTCNNNGNASCIGNLKAGIKTSGGNGNVFVVRPSAVIGLLTDATLSSKNPSTSGTASALAGVDVWVTVTPPAGAQAPTLYPNYPITYDSRFVQISSNLLSVLSTQCAAVTGGCYFSFNESTISAHSFDWIVTGLQSGTYGITVNWQSALGNAGISDALTCVGPMNFTVEQNKVFNQNSINSF